MERVDRVCRRSEWPSPPSVPHRLIRTPADCIPSFPCAGRQAGLFLTMMHISPEGHSVRDQVSESHAYIGRWKRHAPTPISERPSLLRTVPLVPVAETEPVRRVAGPAAKGETRRPSVDRTSNRLPIQDNNDNSHLNGEVSSIPDPIPDTGEGTPPFVSSAAVHTIPLFKPVLMTYPVPTQTAALAAQIVSVTTHTTTLSAPSLSPAMSLLSLTATAPLASQ